MTMRNFVLTLALALTGVNVAFADGIPTAVDPKNEAQPPWTITVFNDDTRTIQSGEVVVWDVADTDVTSSLRPYVITTTTVDDPWTAGVMASSSCGPGEACTLIVRGIALVRCADATDAVGANTTVGTSAIPGLCGDFTPAANKTSLGLAIGGGGGAEYNYIPVFVNIGGITEQ